MDITKSDQYEILKEVAEQWGMAMTLVSDSKKYGQDLESSILNIMDTVYKCGFVDGQKEIAANFQTTEQQVLSNFEKIFK